MNQYYYDEQDDGDSYDIYSPEGTLICSVESLQEAECLLEHLNR